MTLLLTAKIIRIGVKLKIKPETTSKAKLKDLKNKLTKQ